MADGIKIDHRKLEKHLKKLRRITPYLDEEMDKALKKTTDEFTEYAAKLAPKGEGELSASLTNRKVDDGVAALYNRKSKSFKAIESSSGWGVYGLWRWFWTEFGTVNTKAQPFIGPVRRLLRKRHQRRMKAALNRSIKKALK